ncbi:MAG: type II restriction endonuclease [Defluviitaleaceae bacterium]|nr:type II restriction endonuclease [Defluviitaleaceae bacterium]
MKFQEYMELSADKRLKQFMSTLSITNRTPDYYVNWAKVERETKTFELELNTLNFLIGKQNIYDEAMMLFKKQPELLKAIPTLVACRDKDIDILRFDDKHNMSFSKINFKNIDTKNIDVYVDFAKETGLLDFLAHSANRSLVDYVYGVEVGLDSNARKNRSGSTMESIVERNIATVANVLNLEWSSQITAKTIRDKWGMIVPVDKSDRRFDGSIFNPSNEKLWLIETNYYGGGGSKLKAVAGEFVTLNKLIKTATGNIKFVWVTDGIGWNTAHLPLSEAFDSIDYIFNLFMLQNKFLSEMVLS